MNPQCKRFEDLPNGIHIHIGSQADIAFLREVVKSMGGPGQIDFVNDDASHKHLFTIPSFLELWPAVNREGGVYMIEDLATQPEATEFFTSLETRTGWNLQAHMIQHFSGILAVSHRHD